MDNQENLRMEYTQTITTLRNWDALFFQSMATTVLGGGISTAVAVFKEIPMEKVKIIIFFIITILQAITILYFGYCHFVAKKKIEVLIIIESELNLIGSYTKSHKASDKNFRLSFIFTICLYIGFCTFTFLS